MQEIEKNAIKELVTTIVVAAGYDESQDPDGNKELKIKSECRNEYGVNCKVVNLNTGYNVKSSLNQLVRAIVIMENQLQL